MEEEWESIKGYEGKYWVSNLGRVKSKRKILTPTKGEYLKVRPSKSGIQKTLYVHRLVADAFIPKIEGKLYVNHKDENKYNNNANNLEWVTFKENMNYGTKQDRESIAKMKYHVEQYDLSGNFIKRWFNLREITINTEYNKTSIQNCCTGKTKTAYGYKWKYIPVK